MRSWLLAFILVFGLSVPGYAGDIEICQATLPTTNGGTADCTYPSFGSPIGALMFGGFGTANNTVVDHAGLLFGVYDATNQTALAFVAEDNVADSNSGFLRDTNSGLATLVLPGKTQNGDCTLSVITDGIRFTCATAPPAAYRINAVLFKGPTVSNIYAGVATGHATQNSVQSITSPAFTPDAVIAISQTSSTGTSGSNIRLSFGIATNEGSIVQRALGFADQNASASMATGSVLSDNRLVTNGYNGATFATLELTALTANGFDVTTRDAATGPAFIYLALKFNGLAVKLGTFPNPAGTGTENLTGVGFRSQFGIALLSELTTINTYGSTDNGEVFGVSAFTANGSGTSSIYDEDGDGTSNAESVTDTKVCRTRKDALDYSTCTFTQWTADGVDLDHTVNAGGAKLRAFFFLQAPSNGTGPMMRRRNWRH